MVSRLGSGYNQGQIHRPLTLVPLLEGLTHGEAASASDGQTDGRTHVEAASTDQPAQGTSRGPQVVDDARRRPGDGSRSGSGASAGSDGHGPTPGRADPGRACQRQASGDQCDGRRDARLARTASGGVGGRENGSAGMRHDDRAGRARRGSAGSGSRAAHDRSNDGGRIRPGAAKRNRGLDGCHRRPWRETAKWWWRAAR